MLKLRAVRFSGNIEEYWVFHLAQEQSEGFFSDFGLLTSQARRRENEQ